MEFYVIDQEREEHDSKREASALYLKHRMSMEAGDGIRSRLSSYGS